MKRGFVMIETIIVISVLSIGLISLYSSYSLLLSKTTTRSNYDNAEYIYRAYFLKKMIAETDIVSHAPSAGNIIKLDSYITNTDFNTMKNAFGLESIYITRMNPNLNSTTLLNQDGSLIKYILSINDYTVANANHYRIIFKFKVGTAPMKNTYFTSLQMPN